MNNTISLDDVISEIQKDPIMAEMYNQAVLELTQKTKEEVLALYTIEDITDKLLGGVGDE